MKTKPVDHITSILPKAVSDKFDFKLLDVKSPAHFGGIGTIDFSKISPECCQHLVGKGVPWISLKEKKKTKE